MTSFLDNIDSREAERLLQTARRRTFARGEVVCHEGDPADTMHLIVKGRFGVRRRSRLGDDIILAVLGPGECFGEMALVRADTGRSATIVALEAAETRSVHRLDFDRVRREHPSANAVIVEALAEAVARLSDQVVEVLYVAAEHRVVRRLRYLAAVYGRTPRGDDGGATIPLTQEELAQLTGTSRATVNKVLRDLQERGVIELRRGATRVADEAGLDRLADAVTYRPRAH